MIKRMRQVNWTYVVTKTVLLMFVIGAAAISFGHIVHVGKELGLTWEAYTVPFFIDGLAILGLIGRSDKFDASTKHAGMYLVTGAGSLSLACNVYAGDNLGQQIYGALVVVGFAAAEWYAGKLKGAPAAAKTAGKPAVKITEAEQAARKRAGYAGLSKAERAQFTRDYRARVAKRSGAMPVQRTAADADARV